MGDMPRLTFLRYHSGIDEGHARAFPPEGLSYTAYLPIFGTIVGFF